MSMFTVARTDIVPRAQGLLVFRIYHTRVQPSKRSFEVVLLFPEANPLMISSACGKNNHFDNSFGVTVL